LRPIYSAPDPQRDIDNQRDDARLNNQIASTQATISNSQVNEANNTWRILSPEEALQAGLPEGPTYRQNANGKVETVTPAPKTPPPGKAAMMALDSVGVNLVGNKDRVADLILSSTSGGLQKAGADVYGFFTGDATDGMKSIAALRTIASDLTLSMTGGSLGNQISDGDRDFISERMGNIADPNVPAAARLAAWNEVKGRLARALDVPAESVFFAGQNGEEDEADLFVIPAPAQEFDENGGLVGSTTDFSPTQGAIVDRSANPAELQGYGVDQRTEVEAPLVLQNGYVLLGYDFDEQGAPIPLYGPGKRNEGKMHPRVQELWDEISSNKELRGIPGWGDLMQQGPLVPIMDELQGVVGGTVDTLVNGGDFSDNYTRNREGEKYRQDQMRDTTGLAGTAVEIASGGAAMRSTAGAANALRVARGISASGRPVSRAAIQRALGKQAGRDGAVIGGAYGAASGDTVEERVTGAAVGTAGGYALGRGGQAIGNRSANRSRGRAPTEAQATIQAADDFNAATGANVRPIPADVGGPLTRRVTGAAAQSPLAVGPIVRNARAVADEAEKGVDALAARAGTAQATRQGAGEESIKGLQIAITRAETRVNAKYAKAEKAAGDVRVPLPKANAQLQREIRALEDTPGLGATASRDLRKLVDEDGAIAGDWSVKGIKRWRSIVYDRTSGDVPNEVAAAASRIRAAADEDIVDGLNAAGKRPAADLYADASKEAAKRFTMLDEIMNPILGKNGEKSAEQVFDAINALGKGDAVKLAQVVRLLPKEQRATLTATTIARMGRTGTQKADSAEVDFDMGTFLRNWTKNTSEPAKKVLFDGETRAALDNLAKVAKASGEAKKYANHSNTTGGMIFNGLIGISSPAGFAVAPVTTTLTAAATTGTQLSARMLADPRVARWLAKMPKQKTPEQVRAHARQLSRIAANDNVLSAEILDLQNWILQSTPRAAADDTQSERRTPQSGQRQ
jgi:hypothetical protein